uniref:DYW domain-containing protein n=1 Tax=Fagus sylvatica TaxID=28930 RepID=A0A2N9EBQ4_FAGSY
MNIVSMVLTTTPSPVPHFLSTFTVNNNNNNGYSANHRNHNRLLLLLNECTDMSQLKQIHAHTLRTTTSTHNPHILFLYSRILHFSSLADFDYASRVFDQVQNPNSFMWNTLMRACARSFDRKEEAIQLYYRMLEEGIVMPDKHTFPFVLKACAYLFALFEGKQVHAHVLKLGYDSDVYINNSLIHLYGTCGCLDIAQKVFDIMPERSVVSWNVMIDAYVRLGEFDTALKLFREMQNMFEPDGYTMQSVISACAGLGALSLGMWTHACALRKCGGDAFDDVLVNNCLVDMYCKWLAMHGKAEAALEYFVRMRTERFVPDSITFVGVLSACNHRGMLSEGHLLARAGLIDEALNLVSDMPIKPDVVIWRSILDACCKKNAGVELSEEMASQILESEGGDCSGVYVLLSRVYASASRWDDVGLVRKLMIDKGVTKEPGCSSIEMNGTSHEFFAGDTSHPQSKEIYQVLDVIEERLKSVGHVPDFSQAPMVDELNNEKQHALKLHSERIAIAFGLLRLKPGMPIRIFKNLRVYVMTATRLPN